MEELQERELVDEAVLEEVRERLAAIGWHGRSMPVVPPGHAHCSGCIVLTDAQEPASRDGYLKRARMPRRHIAAGAPLCPACRERFDAGAPLEELLDEAGVPVTADALAALTEPIAALALSRTCTQALGGAGIVTVADLVMHRRHELRLIRRIGLQSVRAIDARLRARGLALRRW